LDIQVEIEAGKNSGFGTKSIGEVHTGKCFGLQALYYGIPTQAYKIMYFLVAQFFKRKDTKFKYLLR
jgi:hypothetical protein